MESSTDKNLADEVSNQYGNLADFSDSEDFTEFARNYFATDFPNPERVGCPPPETITTLIQSNNLPDEKLRAHLHSCSECFREFRSAMATHQAAVMRSKPSWWDSIFSLFTQKPVPTFAAIIAVMGITILAVFIWRSNSFDQQNNLSVNRQSDEQNKASTNNAQTKNASSPETVSSPSTVKEQSAANVRGEKELVAVNRVKDNKIELEAHSVSRGANTSDNNGKQIVLPRARIRRVLVLPPDSKSGNYRVMISDVFGEPLVKWRKAKSKGKTLIVDLDLRGIKEKKALLCVKLKNEMRNCYPVVIGNPNRNK